MATGHRRWSWIAPSVLLSIFTNSDCFHLNSGSIIPAQLIWSFTISFMQTVPLRRVLSYLVGKKNLPFGPYL